MSKKKYEPTLMSVLELCVKDPFLLPASPGGKTDEVLCREAGDEFRYEMTNIARRRTYNCWEETEDCEEEF